MPRMGAEAFAEKMHLFCASAKATNGSCLRLGAKKHFEGKLVADSRNRPQKFWCKYKKITRKLN